MLDHHADQGGSAFAIPLRQATCSLKLGDFPEYLAVLLRSRLDIGFLQGRK